MHANVQGSSDGGNNNIYNMFRFLLMIDTIACILVYYYQSFPWYLKSLFLLYKSVLALFRSEMMFYSD